MRREACEWSRNYLELEEMKIRKQFEEEGMEIIDLKRSELDAFKELVRPLREQLKHKYGEEAYNAFRIDVDKN